MTDIQIEAQYSTGVSPQAIEQALVAAGKDLGHLRPADLALLEDFHTMGRIATAQLAGLAEITPGDEVLDAGSGIGGTARYVAERIPDRLRTAIETAGFEIDQWNDLTGPAATMMQTLLTLPPSTIGLQAFVPGFESKATNLIAALADGRLRAIQGLARTV